VKSNEIAICTKVEEIGQGFPPGFTEKGKPYFAEFYP